MATIHCLGGGLVGSFVTKELLKSKHEVHLFDIEDIETKAILHIGDAIQADHSDADLIINMLPGKYGHSALERLKTLDKKILDLSFSEITPDNLTEVNATILWDVGIAPGLSNMLVAKAMSQLAILDKVTIKVGGNPQQPDDNWSYMAPFSPHDVIAEYTRPARVVRDGKKIALPAISDLHSIEVDGNQMDAFLSDGLRSLLDIKCKHMGEYTIRWPGHIQKYISSRLKPDDLVEQWKFNPDIPEFTWMEVMVKSADQQLTWIIRDEGKDGDSSMARSTGLVTVACALLWLDNPKMLSTGIHPPEDLPIQIIDQVIGVLQKNSVSINKI